MALDGEEQDAYILGVNEPVDKFTGKIMAIVHRKDDIEEKLLSLTDEPAKSATIEAVKMAKAAGVLISYDLDYRPSLWISIERAVKKMKTVVELVDVMKVSDEESTLLTEAKSYEPIAVMQQYS